ncbi:glycerophosphodiester phosphodiesterase family protein [Brevibacterium gallinarum]|uniref:Glycerophosphodiester phosphodiesterase n=1 Tax=Brevibacterium gallinarum TaxID=2762220 RepID=A0ABR8WV66_9MICO|nr:glycerophosphodiester phosphodiesterase family protein [Brevibacterium gallinarum]MBD8020827.1 glycerophosphodiester phosphodiesterase [Brevibacterium gallinarum]
MTATRPDIIAHRGGLWPGTAENTMAAFEHAVAHGVTMLETDVHLSADGVLFAAHDDDLQRIAGRPEQLAALPAAELESIELIAGGTLPRLADLLAAFPTAHFNIDVKADRSAAAVIRLLRDRSDTARLRLASFSTRRLHMLRQALPGIATSLGTTEVVRLRLLGARGWRLDPSVDAVQVPASRCGFPVITAGFIRAAHSLGLRVDAWTINEPAEMQRLARLGVDGLVTDEPLTARAALAEAV